jgi:plasmid maintenance system antidote protein VapI
MNENIVDDRGTTQEKALEMLHALREDGFDGDVQKLAVVLGRDEEELNEMLDGEAEIDDDLVMKMRGIAQARDIEIE